jgi:hypothetical protein
MNGGFCYSHLMNLFLDIFISFQSEKVLGPKPFKLLQHQRMDFTSFIHPMNDFFSDNLHSSVLEVKGFVLNGFRRF